MGEQHGSAEMADERTLALVAKNLALWQEQIRPMRRIAGGEVENAHVEDWLSGLDPEVQEQMRARWAKEATRSAELDRLYGDAVGRVEGAQDQDLGILDEVGMLLEDPDDWDVEEIKSFGPDAFRALPGFLLRNYRK